MRLIVYDKDQDVIDTLKKHMPQHNSIEFRCIELADLQQKQRIDTVVWPSTSFELLVSGAGVPDIGLYGDIAERAKNRIVQFRVRTLRGRRYLPIGSAVPMSTGSPAGISRARYIVIVPIMFTEEDISTTDNVYFAFLGLLHWINKATKNMPGMCVASPCIGMGPGGMEADQVAEQIGRAVQYFKDHPDYPGKVFREDYLGFVLKHPPCIQPESKVNRRIPGQKILRALERKARKNMT